MSRAQLISYVNSQPWAIQVDALRSIVAALTAPEALQPVAATARPVGSQGAIAVIPITGTITQRSNGIFEMFFGGTSTERISQMFRQALADSSVSAIVIDLDSPGGGVSGVDELSTEIFQARGAKPVVAIANALAASAAYWIATAADRLVVTPSGEVGSVGVWSAHVDYSKMLEAEGMAVTLVSAGKFKVEGNPYQPLSEEARAYTQSRVDDYYNSFVKAVARNRGVTPEAVRTGYGEGRVVGARQAVQMGMADQVGTFDDAISMAQRMARQTKTAGRNAERLFQLRSAGL